MSEKFSHQEKRLAELLSSFPKVKRLLKRFYTYATFPFYYKSKSVNSVHTVKSLSRVNGEVFFGYYDKVPLRGNYILAHATTLQSSKKPPLDGQIDIVVVDKNNLETTIVKTKSKAFNWQQGSRAHWINDEEFIYNDFETKSRQFVSMVFSVTDNRVIKTFEKPVQDSFKDSYFLSINYSRLQTLRPDYGYNNLGVLDELDLQDLSNDGIWYTDMETGAVKLIYPLSTVVNTDCEKHFSESTHWANHLMISPNGEKFIFLHRYLYRNKRFTRLLISDLNTNELRVLSNFGMVSHCCWLDNNNILAYLKGPGNIDAFWTINIKSGKHKKLEFDGLENYGDGHPTFFNDVLVFDSYPDKGRLQHLYKCDFKTKKVTCLGSFLLPLKYFGESRCDLHPRLTENSRTLFFDSAHSGKRELCFMELND